MLLGAVGARSSGVGAGFAGVVAGEVCLPVVGAVDGVTGVTAPDDVCVVEVDGLVELPGAAVVGVVADAGIPLFRTANHMCATFCPWS